MTMPLRAALLALVTLSACGTLPGTPSPSATLPQDPASGLADPGRNAILNTAYAFSTPGSLVRRPADAAQAVAQAEFLAVDLTGNQRWREFSPLVALGFQQARPEWRSAVGIAQDAPPQSVINALFSARDALLRGDASRAAAALPAPVFPGGGDATLARLAALPALPRTASAAQGADNELARMQTAPDE